jgi:uncharacterized protein YeaO (DUF488 family)
MTAGNIHTRRWSDPAERDDGTRILICRYRPRGVRKEGEPWDEWMPNLGPSKELHAAAYGKTGDPIPWSVYRARYLTEMRAQRDAIRAVSKRVARGETITLLCATSCPREDRCHRSLLRDLIARIISGLNA